MMKLKILCLTIFMISCGNKSFFDCEDPVPGIPCEEPTAEEKARKSLKEGDYAQAVLYLEEATQELLSAEGLTMAETYRLHPLLSSAYGAKADIDMVRLSQAQFGGQQSFLATLNSALPNPKDKGDIAYRQCLSDVKEGTNVLGQIPQILLSELENDIFGKSVSFQKTLYNTAYSVMAMNLFAISAKTGTFDRSQLESMSENDALDILTSLEAAGKVPQSDNPAMQQKINETLSKIDSEPGESKKAKLSEFITKNQS